MDAAFSDQIKALQSGQAEEVIKAAHCLGEAGEKRAIPYLQDLLIHTENPWIRNAVAVSLGELKAQETVPLLVKLIKREINTDNYGTLVYALQFLNCADIPEDLAFLICHGNYEASEMALQALQNMDAHIDRDKRERACNILREYLGLIGNLEEKRAAFINEAIEALGP